MATRLDWDLRPIWSWSIEFWRMPQKKQLPIHQWPLCSYDRHLTRIRKMCFNRMRICWRPFRPFSWDLAIGPSSGTSWRIPPLDLKHFKAATREHVRSFGILPLRVKMVKWSVCGIRNRRLIAHLNAIEPCSSDSILGTGPVPEISMQPLCSQACVECNIDKLKSAVEDGAIAEFSRIFLLGCWSSRRCMKMRTRDKHPTNFHKEWPDLVFVQSRAGRFQNLKTVKLCRFMVYFDTGKLSNLLTGQGILGGFGQVRMSLCLISPGSCLGCSLLMAFCWWHPQTIFTAFPDFPGPL